LTWGKAITTTTNSALQSTERSWKNGEEQPWNLRTPKERNLRRHRILWPSWEGRRKGGVCEVGRGEEQGKGGARRWVVVVAAVVVE
jgi:hypothetical protein